MIKLGGNWDTLLQDLFVSEQYAHLRTFLKNAYAQQTIYPDMYSIYRAFQLTALTDLKVVLLGQDPYHNVGQANGLAFSVQDGIALPPSLCNIFKEIDDDINSCIDKHIVPTPFIKAKNGDLTSWAKQGVLLLNTALTVKAHSANSHKELWQWFTDAVIEKISANTENIVFILWGNNAKSKKRFIDADKHYILEAAHPSPLSAHNGFFGCKHFSKTNQYLYQVKKTPIDWNIYTYS